MFYKYYVRLCRKSFEGIVLEVLIYWQIPLVVMGEDLFLTVLLKFALKDVSEVLKLLKSFVIANVYAGKRLSSLSQPFFPGMLPSSAR